MTDLPVARLRTGRRNPRTLYLQRGDQPVGADEPGADEFVGHARTPEIARQAVEGFNEGTAVLGAAEWWFAGDEYGALIYDRSTARFASGWVLAVESRATADRIVAGVNGVVPDA